MSRSYSTISPPRSEADVVTSRAVGQALDAVRDAPGIVPGLRLVDDLVAAAAAAGGDGPCLAELTRAVADPDDQLTAIAAVHALGALPASAGAPHLVELLRTGPTHLAEHAAWALGEGTVIHEAVHPLVTMLAAGEFGGMLAQRALERWGAAEPDAVGVALAAVAVDDRPEARTRAVETLGLVPGQPTTQLLLAHASDRTEELSVRAAAVAALGVRPSGGRPEVAAMLTRLSTGVGPLADTARTALHDLDHRSVARAGTGRRRRASDGLSVVHLFLHADIDATLSHAGRGDNGGIATLLVQLGDALRAQDGVERVVTISRGTPADALHGLDDLRAPGHHYAAVPLWGTPPHQAQAWSLRVAARRGIRRILRAAAPVDVLHLRMADVGSMAAAEAARELGIPVVFTLAPDPHALLASREAAGTLTRAGFGAADQVEHLVLRDQLVRGIASEAAHLVLFPRPDIDRDLRDLLGVDLADPRVRASVVAEGVDLAAVDRARSAATGATRADAPAPPPRASPHLASPHLASPHLADLRDLDVLLESLPKERRHLPLAVSVGRLHRVKGMATLVGTWATDPALSGRCNLLVVGGDLRAPSDDESGELDRIAAAVPPGDAAGRGLLLAGHRPNPVVALWLAAARVGRPGLAGPDGVYVSASLKEEFGIAILEAMAAGLVVVAPAGGGPATYVEDGLTGVLVDTTSAPALADAVTRALALAGDPDAVSRADTARASLRDRFGIDTMAAALERVYRGVASGSAGGPGRQPPRETALYGAAR